MKKLHFVILFVFLLSTVLNHGNAQQISIPYICGFEDATENANWTLNANPRQPISTFTNLWYIGTATASQGENSLYISSDQGTTASFTFAENTVLAYREFSLPIGTYDFSFDWKASNTGVTLYCALVPTTVTIYSYNNVSDLPTWLDTYALTFEGSNAKELRGASSWTSARCQLNISNAQSYRLVFLWNNANYEGKPGGCVDNIQIFGTSCGRPSDLSAKRNGNAVTLTWSGDAAYYNIRYQKSDDSNVYDVSSVNDTTLTLSGLSDGVYDFWIQSICADGEESMWECFSSVLIYEALCIDFLNLDSAYCSTGTCLQSSMSYDNEVQGRMDFGYASKMSRHTIHYMQDEYDAQTDFGLKTVPDGEFASVRLGNWDTGAEAERIRYNYTVNADDAAVLLLKYAVVIECPINHPITNQPRFLLEMFGENGEKLDACTSADFSARLDLVGQDGWHQVGPETSPTLWKDWTTVGINLQEYDGQTITIQLTTFDCSQSGHFGYAYFTLGCDEGVVQGINCGEYPTTQFVAPEGFNYSWRKKYVNRDEEISTEQILEVDPSDTTTYEVDVIYPTMAECYFTLEASAIPRFPVASFEYELVHDGCKNEVRFNNTSYIWTENGITGKPVESVLWDFGNGQSSALYSPTVQYPNEGGEYKIKLTAELCDGLCWDDTVMTIVLPSVGDTLVKKQIELCEQDTYDFFGNIISEEGIYYDTLKTIYGCDSIIELSVNMYSKSYTEIWDTICADSVYLFGDRYLTNTGDYRETFVGHMGCDSVVDLHLIVTEPLVVTYELPTYICADEPEFTLHYNTKKGILNDITIAFNAVAQEQGFQDFVFTNDESGSISIPIPSNVKPNTGYSMTLSADNGYCGEYFVEIDFDINYPADIVTQKWDDALAIYNSMYNGGYEFSAYEWYKDGQKIAGASSPYLYLPDEKLDKEALYNVLLTRVEDGVQLFSCPLAIIDKTSLSVYPTMLPPSENVVVETLEDGIFSLWDIMGVRVKTGEVKKKIANTITMPSSEGVYILKLQLTDGSVYQTQIMVK